MRRKCHLPARFASAQRVAAPRRGSIAILGIFLLLTMLTLAALVLTVSSSSEVLLQERQRAFYIAEAGIATAIKALNSRIPLDPDLSAIEAGREEARFYYEQNGGVLPWVDDDIQFGFYDPINKTLTITQDGSSVPTINAVQVKIQRTSERGTAFPTVFGGLLGLGSIDIRAPATVFFDQDVHGFRPVVRAGIPLVPLPLLSDPTGADPRSWEFQVELRNGPDVFRFDPSTDTFVSDASGDGTSEFQVQIALTPAQLPNANATALFLGNNGFNGVATQTNDGVKAEDLVELGGQIVLDTSSQAAIDGSQLGPNDPSPELNALIQSLQQLQLSGQPRVWPLYTSFDSGTNRVIVSGFVAARVVLVQPQVPGQPLFVTLQAGRMPTGAALTDPTRRGTGVPLQGNRYVGRLRQIQ